MTESRRVLGPFNRVEGDLELHVEAAGDRVARAWVNAPLYRGFERMLSGREPSDALVITPRICGICSVAQSVAAARALADAQGIAPTSNGALAINLVLAAENLADHLSHFYLFFMPDFAREHYAGRAWHQSLAERFTAQRGSAMTAVLRARAEWLHLTGILAGKWPHSLALQPGGSTRAINRAERVRLQAIIGQFVDFVEAEIYGGASLEQVAALDCDAALRALCERHPNGDLARFVALAEALELHLLGPSKALPISVGAYPDSTGRALFKAGCGDRAQALDIAQIREDSSCSWLADEIAQRHPREGRTEPRFEPGGDRYSWCKAPRLDGQVVEVGALARQRVDGQALLCALVAEHGSNVFSRELARLIEFARVLPAMREWAAALNPDADFIHHAQTPSEGTGCGLVEAARGSLGHWLSVAGGRIANYQIVAPTTWNFSPRDGAGLPGALESALVGSPLAARAEDSLALQHIIRSYDPCMVCTVH